MVIELVDGVLTQALMWFKIRGSSQDSGSVCKQVSVDDIEKLQSKASTRIICWVFILL